MEPFNLKEAEEGKPVCNRIGNDVRIICFDRISKYPIVALHSSPYLEQVCTHTSNGKSHPEVPSSFDLFMKE
jgi:hypothetical protein